MNYNPITLTLIIYKILEKFVKIRLTKFLNKNMFFSKNQFGLRNNVLANDALYYSIKII